MSVRQHQICLGCKKQIDLLDDGYRCLDCPFFFCRPCAEYHFGKTDVSPVTGLKDRPIVEPGKVGVGPLVEHDAARTKTSLAERTAPAPLRITKDKGD